MTSNNMEVKDGPWQKFEKKFPSRPAGHVSMTYLVRQLSRADCSNFFSVFIHGQTFLGFLQTHVRCDQDQNRLAIVHFGPE